MRAGRTFDRRMLLATAMRRLALTVLVLATAPALTAPAAAYDETDLKRKIAAEMRRAGSASGAYLSDAATGRPIYGVRADRRLIPASVEKMYTTSTALLTLGPAATLQTAAVTAGTVDEAGVLHGDLVLVGGGDPFFGAQGSARIAAAVSNAGIRRIDGAVVGDESFFDRRRAARFNGYDGDLTGVLSALAYDRGIFRGRAQLAAGRFAAARFAAQLRKVGVRSSKSSRAGTAPAGAAQIAAWRSMSVAELSRFVNVPSNNFAAEMLLKGLGARFSGKGSTSAGASVARRTLAKFGLHPRIEDGSGLSRANRTTPRQVVRLLEGIYPDPAGPAFRASLAVAGRTGTVARRMRGTRAAGRCRVKTGTLSNVSALAGYCRAGTGRDITFALLMNRVSPPGARAIQDRIAIALARLDEG
jgi:D-alanyl-D-alanine carboxypeptidase/D-alanyl-D-alanine-endopeptidase (penicillin-binding protein 4)